MKKNSSSVILSLLRYRYLLHLLLSWFHSATFIMPRCRGSVWFSFTAIAHNADFNSSRIQCKHCKSTVSRSTKNMRTHIINCKSVPRTLGRLSSSFVTEASPLLIIDEKSGDASRFSGTLTHFLKDTFSTEDKKDIDRQFANAMQCTAKPF